MKVRWERGWVSLRRGISCDVGLSLGKKETRAGGKGLPRSMYRAGALRVVACGVNAAFERGYGAFSLTLVLARDEVKSASCSEWKTPHEGLPLTHKACGAENGEVIMFHTNFMLFVLEKSSKPSILERGCIGI